MLLDEQTELREDDLLTLEIAKNPTKEQVRVLVAQVRRLQAEVEALEEDDTAEDLRREKESLAEDLISLENERDDLRYDLDRARENWNDLCKAVELYMEGYDDEAAQRAINEAFARGLTG
jgi:uncharacterized protein YhaN